jgi:hypothetical protein
MATGGEALKSTIMSMAPSRPVTAARSVPSRCRVPRLTGSGKEINRMRLARAMANAIMPDLLVGSMRLAYTTHLVDPHLT